MITDTMAIRRMVKIVPHHLRSSKNIHPNCLVLDLDNTLIHTIKGDLGDLVAYNAVNLKPCLTWKVINYNSESESEDLISSIKPSHFDKYFRAGAQFDARLPRVFVFKDIRHVFNVFVRPGVQNLLRYIQLNHIKFGVWTAGNCTYASMICHELFKGMTPEFIIAGVRKLDPQNNHFFIKPLIFIENTFGFNSQNMLIVDDNDTVCDYESGNSYHISPWKFYMSDDTQIFKFIEYLDKSNE